MDEGLQGCMGSDVITIMDDDDNDDDWWFWLFCSFERVNKG